ncbi:hypothetical protein QQ045_015381 [Rhodiola kirilowii]
MNDLPWVVMGDFNEVCFSWKAVGVKPRDESNMRRFREVLDFCGLSDLGFEGKPYTFTNKRRGNREAKARLDRVVANGSWRMLFPDHKVNHIWANASDHCPIAIDLVERRRCSKSSDFKFETMWMKHDKYLEKFEEIWKGTMGKGLSFSQWNREEFGNVQKRIKILKAIIQEVQKESRSEETITEERKLADELDKWLGREECLWRQRARTEWLKEGDRNTAFFHVRASHRRNINRIRSLQKYMGEVVSDDSGFLGIVEGYFHKVIASNNNAAFIDWQRTLDDVPKRVTDEMNAYLDEPFTMEEIRRSLYQMCPTKASRADDSLVFIKADVEIVRKLKQILHEYEQVSGQMINYSKSKVCFNPNVNQQLRSEISEILGIREVAKHGKYLGLPMVAGQNKVECFRALEENLQNKIKDWKSKLLSAARKEVLIKSTLTAMPQYAMTCYKLPVTVCRRLNSDIINFWWSSKDKGRSVHWINKSTLFREKSQGGLDLRDLECVNDAFILKQGWRMISKPDALMSRVFKARYWSNCDFWSAGVGVRPSHVWRGICKFKKLLRQGMEIDQQTDQLRWSLSSTGEFSVRTTYDMIKRHREEIMGNYGSSSDNSLAVKYW